MYIKHTVHAPPRAGLKLHEDPESETKTETKAKTETETILGFITKDLLSG